MKSFIMLIALLVTSVSVFAQELYPGRAFISDGRTHYVSDVFSGSIYLREDGEIVGNGNALMTTVIRETDDVICVVEQYLIAADLAFWIDLAIDNAKDEVVYATRAEDVPVGTYTVTAPIKYHKMNVHGGRVLITIVRHMIWEYNTIMLWGYDYGDKMLYSGLVNSGT